MKSNYISWFSEGAVNIKKTYGPFFHVLSGRQKYKKDKYNLNNYLNELSN